MLCAHRGHIIRLVEGPSLRAELIEARTGALLPTMVMGSAGEGSDAVAARARRLIDLYLESASQAQRRPGPPLGFPAGTAIRQ